MAKKYRPQRYKENYWTLWYIRTFIWRCLFYSRVPLKVFYENNEGSSPVYFGNVIKPSEATQKPIVSYECDKNTLWALTLVNPDGHLTEQTSEYIHWFV